MLNPEFLLTALVVVLVPGTGVIYTISIGLFCGWRKSVAAALGCTAGIIPHLAASVLGLSVILHTSAVAFQGIKYAGCAYLLYLAWSMWRETGAIEFNSTNRNGRPIDIAVKGVLINILNPKLSIFFLAFLPLFVLPDAKSPTYQMLLLSAAFMGMTITIFALYGLLASSVRTYLIRSPMLLKWLRRSFGAMFAALAAKLALSER